MNKFDFKNGLKAGMPIGLGYLSVAFTFGIMSISIGLDWWQALLISMLTLTSAGQVAAVKIMINPGCYIEMLVSQATINMRYSFMSVALSQKTDSKFKKLYKWILGFFITDEIFAVAVNKEKVSRSFLFGLAVLPYLGWSFGTLVGALIGNVLPSLILNSLSIAIYCMFIAIIIPPAKKNKSISIAITISLLLSVGFYYIPKLNEIPSGISISITAILAAIICALFFPKKEEIEDE